MPVRVYLGAKVDRDSWTFVFLSQKKKTGSVLWSLTYKSENSVDIQVSSKINDDFFIDHKLFVLSTQWNAETNPRNYATVFPSSTTVRQI